MVYLLKMVIFHSYVSLPEGVYIYIYVYTVYRTQSNTYYETAKQHLLCIHSSVIATFPKCFGYIYIYGFVRKQFTPKNDGSFVMSFWGPPNFHHFHRELHVMCSPVLFIGGCYYMFPTFSNWAVFKAFQNSLYSILYTGYLVGEYGFPLWIMIIPKYS